ncbi:hypothetical protein HPB50_023894 [Hyalomma asiaticum]|uniref:Uncharacterized protein n=1 Tax=Hyalomma asiaticum TaxID=266040 RepID=A0ACB7TPX6_HYAAI|nr:hypothetical protein HPB50_023894 [Hyalomma asiaticum]
MRFVCFHDPCQSVPRSSLSRRASSPRLFGGDELRPQGDSTTKAARIETYRISAARRPGNINTGQTTARARRTVVDVNTKEKLGPGELGEIRIKSPCCAVGYLNNPEASAALYDEEGFLKTGDIGYYDKQGLFYFTDRVKDIIKCMEEQVPPTYLEELLLQHEAVREVAVVGVQHADYGEAARAFVVLNDGYKPTDTLRNTLLNIVADQTTFKKHLHGGLEFATNIPISPTGKPLRAALKDAHVKRLQPSVQ